MNVTGQMQSDTAIGMFGVNAFSSKPADRGSDVGGLHHSRGDRILSGLKDDFIDSEHDPLALQRFSWMP